jgi:hypothetical protein
VDALCEASVLVRLVDGSLKVTEQSGREREQDLATVSKNDDEAKKVFIECLKQESLLVDMDPEQCWQWFNSECLVPLVQGLGARTYELLSGKGAGAEPMLEG